MILGNVRKADRGPHPRGRHGRRGGYPFAIAMGKRRACRLNLEGVQNTLQNPSNSSTGDKRHSRGSHEAHSEHYGFPYGRTHRETHFGDQVGRCAGRRVLDSAEGERYGDIARAREWMCSSSSSTVTTVRHVSSEYESLDFERFCKRIRSRHGRQHGELYRGPRTHAGGH